MAKSFAGYGKKRPQIVLSSEKLLLDPANPRLTEEIQGKNQEILLSSLYKDFDLRELAESLSQNGYFDEEPLVAIPKDLPKIYVGKSYEELNEDESYYEFINNKDTKLIVVEGNRRLASVKILLSDEIKTKLRIKGWPELSDPIMDDLEGLPVIVYPERDDVIPYLGVRHITGIKKWDPYAKARYIASMYDSGTSIDDIQKKVGDKGQSIRKSYVCYKLIDIMEEEEEGSASRAKYLFSYLMLSLGQGPIKEYLGVKKKWSDVDVDNPISIEKNQNLRNLFSFLYGDGEKKPVISESRDITRYLTDVLRKKESTDELLRTRDLYEAFDRSDGEEKLVIKQLTTANRKLEKVLGIVHRNKTEDVRDEVEKCKDTLNQISKVLEQ